MLKCMVKLILRDSPKIILHEVWVGNITLIFQIPPEFRCFRYVFGVQIPPNPRCLEA